MSDLSDALTPVAFDIDAISTAVNASYAQARGEDLSPTAPVDFNDPAPAPATATAPVVGGQPDEPASPLPPSSGEAGESGAGSSSGAGDPVPASGSVIDSTFDPPVTDDGTHTDGFVIAEVAGAPTSSTTATSATTAPTPTAQISGGGGGPDGSAVSSPPEPIFSLDEMARAAYGTLTPEQAMAMFDTYDRLAQMPPHLQQAAIDILNGNIDGAVSTLSPYARPTAPAPAPTTQPTARPRVVDPLYGDDDDQYAALPPEVQQRIDALEAQQQQFLAQQQQQYLDQITQQATLGLHDFANTYSTALTQGEIAGLQYAVNQASQFVDSKARARGGDYRTAYYEALETHLYANPELREKVLSVSHAGAPAPTPTQPADQARQHRAASVATNTGNANTPGTVQPSPTGSPLAAMPGGGGRPALPTDRPPTQAEMIAAVAKMIPQSD